MILEPTIIAIIVAKIRGGKFKNLEEVDIKSWYLLILSAIIQFIASIINKKQIIIGGFAPKDYLSYFHILSYIFMIICILLNLRKHSMKAFLIGVLLNFLVIFANGGKMPVSLNGIRGLDDNIGSELPISDFDIKHYGINPDTKLVYLSDIILISKPYLFPKILSIGDLFIMLGLFMFIQENMVIYEKSKSQL